MLHIVMLTTLYIHHIEKGWFLTFNSTTFEHVDYGKKTSEFFQQVEVGFEHLDTS
jgi:hypothetical protein